jgi:hypothetical protein
MKKILLIIGVVALIDSCKKKEEPLCNCGVIESDNVKDFSILIRNECTDNYKTFYLNQDDWMKAYVDTRYCINNLRKW